MTDAGQPPAPDRIRELLDDGAHEALVSSLHELRATDMDACKRAIRALRERAEERPTAFDGLVGPLAALLTDDDRAVRLTTAKLFVTVAQSAPALVVPAVDTLGARLADEGEFYYVRARCAEALGYVALDCPDAVSDPELLAELRVGLAFEETEVKEKLAKALEYVALGDPDRLRHQVGQLAGHLDDESELVRYHLATALVVVGAGDAERLVAVRDRLVDRLDDPNPYVRGRAAEAVGLLASDGSELPAALQQLTESDESFVAERAQFALTAGEADGDPPSDDSLGTVASVRSTTDEAATAISTPDADGACPHCGCELPPGGPPMCPQCGAPR